MIYRFKIVSDEVDNFCREIKIDSEANFLQLRNAILESVDYTKDEMNSFFICDDEWNKEEEVTLEDMGSDSDQDVWLMDDTALSELIEEEGQHIIFEFDYLTQRSFFMELKEIITGQTLMDPLCTRKEGKAPRQKIDLDEFDAKLEKNKKSSSLEDDLDLDFYGDSSYNDDELNGFEDLNFN